MDLGFEVSGDVATVRTAMDLAIPKSAAAEVVTQCLRQFLTEQLKKVGPPYVCMYICMYVCMYVCICICTVYVYDSTCYNMIYIYILCIYEIYVYLLDLLILAE